MLSMALKWRQCRQRVATSWPELFMSRCGIFLVICETVGYLISVYLMYKVYKLKPLVVVTKYGKISGIVCPPSLYIVVPCLALHAYNFHGSVYNSNPYTVDNPPDNKILQTTVLCCTVCSTVDW